MKHPIPYLVTVIAMTIICILLATNIPQATAGNTDITQQLIDQQEEKTNDAPAMVIKPNNNISISVQCPYAYKYQAEQYQIIVTCVSDAEQK
jgi:hypothetical protein